MVFGIGLLISKGLFAAESQFRLPGKPPPNHLRLQQAFAQPGIIHVSPTERFFILTPLQRGDGSGTAATLNGFAIGQYPPAEEFGPTYAAPAGLIEVTEANKHTLVSTHFRLEQFLCKQPGGWPKYIALQRPLLDQLEHIVELLNAKGLQGRSLVVMSGYRTPRYNAGLGNVPRSRHLYGDAADIFLDANGDGLMDDLNQDGRLDVGDSIWLARLIDANPPTNAQGGLAAYRPTSAHGAFVHIDTRGEVARWGVSIEGSH